MAVTMSDGTELNAPMTTPHPWQDLSYAETDLATRELTMRLRGGQTLVVELGGEGEDDVPAPGRPVVYLDQRHWVTLAQRLHNPDAIAQADRQPAEHLIELSRSKTLVLPLSSANLWEIAPTGRHRRDVALTMVELSRGWQLREPVSVRGQELRGVMAGESPALAEAVITLEPGAIFGADFSPLDGAELPDDWRALSERMTNAEASLAASLRTTRQRRRRSADRLRLRGQSLITSSPSRCGMQELRENTYGSTRWAGSPATSGPSWWKRHTPREWVRSSSRLGSATSSTRRSRRCPTSGPCARCSTTD